MSVPPTTDRNQAPEDFRLEILSQRWLSEGEQADYDTCSHGTIRAVIGGAIVTAANGEYGISQSALSLLRSVEHDHLPASTGFDEYLLCDGCGYPFSLGCSNFGTDWVVEHQGDAVVLRDVRHYDVTPGRIAFDVRADLSLRDYAREVARFAQAAQDFYVAAPPRRMPDHERSFHDAFWREFDERLAAASDIAAR